MVDSLLQVQDSLPFASKAEREGVCYLAYS